MWRITSDQGPVSLVNNGGSSEAYCDIYTVKCEAI